MARPYKGTISLPADTTAHRLSDCIKAAAGAGTGGDAGASARYCGWTLTADPANAGDLYIGGANVSSTIYGVTLGPADDWTVGSGNLLNNKETHDYWIRGSANSLKFHFEGEIA